MPRVRPYYADQSLSAVFYDVVTAADGDLAGDVEMYARLAPSGGSVLELGAGAGRVAFGLAERGLEVTGVDRSPAMLAQARARLAAAPADVAARLEFRLGDMTALELQREFDLVIAAYFTLAHVPTGAAWRNVFTVMARQLKPGGRAAVHLPRVELMTQPAPDRGVVVLERRLPGGGRLQLHVLERSFREQIGRFDQVIEYVERDAAGAVVRRSPERLTYYVTDPVPAAATAGLTPVGPPERLGHAGEVWVFAKA
jgi:SAM-dependent methyltransferase